MNVGDRLAVPPELAVNVERWAVYRCYADDGQLLYIGYTGDLGTRLAAHAQKLWFTQVRGITLEWYADELDARNAERRAIHVEHPKYNVVHRNSSSAVPRAQGRPVAKRRTATLSPAERKHLIVEKARQMLAAEPNMTGSDLGDRLGVSQAHGRKLRAHIVHGRPIT
jgi:predicted GIY-YIG superfamily endonuclease